MESVQIQFSLWMKIKCSLQSQSIIQIIQIQASSVVRTGGLLKVHNQSYHHRATQKFMPKTRKRGGEN